MNALHTAAPIHIHGHHGSPTPVNRPIAHRWCAPYSPLADQPLCPNWPDSLQTLWRACRAARDTLAALEAAAEQHPFDRDLWRLVDAAHATWLDIEGYAQPRLPPALGS